MIRCQGLPDGLHQASGVQALDLFQFGDGGMGQFGIVHRPVEEGAAPAVRQQAGCQLLADAPLPDALLRKEDGLKPLDLM